MTLTKKIDFYRVTSDILEDPSFINLENDKHHGITRYEHSLRVAKCTYVLGRKLHMKHCVETTRASLLHDFYTNTQLEDYNKLEKLIVHPHLALQNADTNFELTDLQKEIIETHMFPISSYVPRHKETYLVSLVDKGVAVYEMARYKLLPSTK